MSNSNKVPNSARVSELWAAIKSKLAGKVDLATLDDYSTIEDTARAIVTALTDYAKSTDVSEAIKSALTEYMTTAEVNQAILTAVQSASKFKKVVTDKLPDVGEEDTLYFVPSDKPSEKNIKLEFMYINGNYEQIGSTTIDMDLYWSKEELQIMSAEELEELLK